MTLYFVRDVKDGRVLSTYWQQVLAVMLCEKLRAEGRRVVVTQFRIADGV